MHIVRNSLLFLSLIFIVPITSCDQLGDILPEELTEAEVVAGLKEALTVGTDTSVTQAHAEDGFFRNEAIKILFPEEAQAVQDVVALVPGGQVLIDELVKKLNRAAEEAAVKAKPIFIDAVTGITINDAFGILNGGETAATQYLQDNTSSSLYTAFRPDIEQALSSVGAQQAWTEVINVYNAVPFVQPVNADLADYTTDKALDGLFHLVGEEEKKIRKDPLHRVTALLEKVFGS